ncbi:tumor protein p53-inducible nuclear protein 2 isoform X3 [Anas platyrhynchos]|uniref:Tumor protein p53 inducible nuclear protein 2 n=1 Tax=Anas platyrhynchos TaxID=8839 RepID=A0A8B9TM26_ANAPL|nr:tumor protein p53-inducible nuclear protein 2 isoform X3 [Anas platyrhynchos]|eukprot:XP_027328719.1 tumor protein p53-inducible nuclear protein 2 isoform X3 [Anas platyrhynchos]
MFQRLTSLFFSDSSLPEGLEEPKPFVSEEEEEDGWLVIDLGEEPGPDGVGSSPMEDLLIEHPSMSVYVTSTLELDAEEPQDSAAGYSPPSSPPPLPGAAASLQREELCLLPTAPGKALTHREVPEPRLERHTPHHTTSLSVKAAILEKVSQARRVQRAKQLAEKPWLSQKALQRQDRARQRPARRARQRAGSFLHQPCQRHCNY